MLENKTIELVGRRVKLIPLTMEHTSALYEAGSFPEVWTYMPTYPRTLPEYEQLVEGALQLREKGTEYPFAIVDQETDRIVGSTRYLDIQPSNRNLEIGWTWLTPGVWRTRVNTECKYLLMQYAFEELDMVRVQLKTDGRNIRSQTAIARIGGVREGVLRRQRILHDGYIRDTVYFSILDTEWEAVKQKLEGFLKE